MAGIANIIREFFSVKELSIYSGICERTLRDLLNASENPIPHYRIGASIKIKRSEFDDWAAKYCHVEKDDRLDRLVNELLTDMGIKPTGRKSKQREKKRQSKIIE